MSTVRSRSSPARSWVSLGQSQMICVCDHIGWPHRVHILMSGGSAEAIA